MATGKGNNNSIGFLELLFQATVSANYATLALNATSSPATNLYVSLHTANPGATGNQTTSEAAYTSYARVAVARTVGGFTVSTNTAALVANVSFPAGTGGSGTATHWGIGASSSGAGKLLYKGAISPTIVCGNGVTPQLTAGTVVTED